MITGTYRKQAQRALLAATTISVLVLGVGSLAALAGSQAFRQLASTIAHMCVRVWAALPNVLQIMLGISAAIALISGVLWLFFAGKQWRGRMNSLHFMRRHTVTPPARVLTLLAKHELAQRVKVIHDVRPRALTVGMITPRIIMSTGLIDTLEDDELEAVLLHEQSHLQNGDPLHLLLARALAAAFFYVPLVRALAQRYQAAIELAADEYVIATQGGALSLSSAIVKLLRARSSTTLAIPFTGAADLRISYLLEQDVNLPGVSRRSMLQSAAALVALMTPVATLYGLAEAFNQFAFLMRCTV
ncbi:MAG: M56 family metallopeptidase [bacterium]